MFSGMHVQALLWGEKGYMFSGMHAQVLLWGKKKEFGVKIRTRVLPATPSVEESATELYGRAKKKIEEFPGEGQSLYRYKSSPVCVA